VPPTGLFHYTTLEALQSILESRELRPSLARHKPNDVRYGEGQYLSDVRPGTMTGSQLSRLLLGQPFEARRFTHYIAIDVTGLTVNLGRPGVFVIPNSGTLDLTGRIIGTGRNSNDLLESAVEPYLRG
jgi:hypothetical protein